MRAAFDQAIKDPQLKAEAKKGKMDLEFMPGDEALKVIKEVLSQPKDVVDEFSKYIKFGE
jgi:tripartite-type tricarboxylate transporter receptor subunit TctC